MANENARRLRRSLTPQEAKLWLHLRAWRVHGYHFRRQRPLERFIVDFVCLKHHLVVEVDGGQHGDTAHATHDAIRDTSLRAEGFRVLRFWNSEVDLEFDGVLETIARAVGWRWTPPTALRAVPPPRSGEG